MTAGTAPSLWAQMAHFGGVVRPLGASSFLNPVGAAVARSGNIFVADPTDNAIKEMVAVNGSIPDSPTVLTVGSGFSHPEGVAVDGSGNVFVADQSNNAVKEIVAGTGGAAAGTVNSSSTVKSLGSGFNQPAGVAVDGSGNVFVADTQNNAVKEMVAVAGSIPASPVIRTLAGSFSQPTSVAVDGNGNVYVADTLNNVVKQIVAGTGGAPAGTVNSSSTVNIVGNGFAEPDGIAVDGSGNVFVADFMNSAVKEIVAVNGTLPASPAIYLLGGGFSLPNGVAVDASGNVFVADYDANAVLEIGPANFGTLAVGATSVKQSLTFNFDSPGILFNTPFVVLTMGAANLDFQAAASQPSTVCIAAHTYFAGFTCTVDVTFKPTHFGQRLGAVQLMGSGGIPIATGYVRGVGTGPQVLFPGNNTPVALGSGLSGPTGVAVDGSGNVFVADSGNGAVKEMVAVSGSIPASPVIRSLGSGFSPLNGVAVDGSGNVFVADSNNNAIKEIVAVDGSIPALPVIRTLGSGFNHPFGVAVDASGNVFVAGNLDTNVTEIVAVNGIVPATPTLRILGSGFNYPLALAVDGSGNVFVGDWANNVLKEIVAVNGTIPASPTIRTWTGAFSVAYGLAVDSNGNVFVADAFNNQVVVLEAVSGSLPASPTVLTLGSGFGHPGGVAVDASGNVFVADFANNAVKQLPYAVVPSLNFATTPVGSTSSDSPQTVTVSNYGNANLSFAIPAAGLNPSLTSNNFVLDNGSNCPQLDASSSAATLAPGAFCTYLVNFSPTVGGTTISGSLALADNNLNASPSAIQNISLSGSAVGGAAAIALTESAVSVPYGTPVTVTAALTGSNGVPTGSLTYTIDGVLEPGAALSAGAAQLILPGTLSSGTHALVVSYAGDVNYPYSSPSQVFTLTVTPLPTTTTLTASASAITPGQSVTLTATVLEGSTPLSSGMVTFFSGATSIGTGALNAQGLATLAITTLQVGSDAITAAYTATTNYATSTSSALTVTVAATPTTTSLTASANSITAGQSVILTATVLAGTTPLGSGLVTFFSGTTSIGTGALNAQGVATLAITTLQVGSNAITAAYQATTDYAASTSSAVNITVAAAPTTTALTASAYSTTPGQSVTLFATVLAGATPVGSGLVTFSSGITSIGTGALNAQGVATLAVTTLPIGSNAITASYAATTDYAASASSAVTVTVAAAPTTTALTASTYTTTPGQSVTLFATVQAGATPVGSGFVTFFSGTTSIGTGALNAQGMATLAVTTLPIGSNAITASYAATTDYAASASSAVTVTVAAAPTTTALTASAYSTTPGQNVTLFATVLAGATPVGSGLVTFSSGITSIGTGALNAQGVATLATATLPIGSNTITAVYQATTDYAASTSSAVTVTVGAAPTTTTLAVSASSITAGQSVTLTATVLAGATPVGSGLVTFSSGAASIGAAQLNANGMAILNTLLLPVGSNNIIASYTASQNDAASTSSTVTITVTAAAPATTTTTLTASANAITAGQSVTLTATVLAGATPVGSGLVTFSSGAASIGAAQLNANGMAILNTLLLPVGSNNIIASYAASQNDAASTSSAVTITVAAASAATTTTTLTASANAITAGQSVTLTAIVLAGATPVSSGVVTFSSGAASIGAAQLNANGMAILNTLLLPVGSNNIIASYAASQNDAASTSSAVTITVTAAPAATTTTTLTASASSITSGQSVTLTATVLAGATPVGSGLVTFSSGAASIGAAQLNANGMAILNTMLLPVGINNITASYTASQNDAASTSPAVIVTVTATNGPPTTGPSYSMTASPTSVSIVRGQTGPTTVTITPVGGYSGMLTLNCGNLPAYATCTFTQNTVPLTGNNQPVQVGLTIATNVEQARLTPPRPTPFSPVFPAMAFWLPAGFAAACKRKQSPKRRRWLGFCLLLAATGAMAAGMLGCGGGTYWKTPLGTSNISVLATPASGNVQALTLTLTITQ